MLEQQGLSEKSHGETDICIELAIFAFNEIENDPLHCDGASDGVKW